MIRKLALFVAMSWTLTLCFGQTSQIAFGDAGFSCTLLDSKFDDSDGGIVCVGHLNNSSTSNGLDLFIAKFNAQKQLVWQKTLPNAGEDYFNRIVITNDGEYVAVGQLFVSGVRRGIISKFNNTDGTLLWSKRSANSASGELFRDVIRTSAGNIAVVGADRFVSTQTNSFVTLFDINGATLWSYYSSTSAADEFMSINQLPNNNLILAGFYTIGDVRYAATISELSESDGAIVAQSSYAINTTVPGWIYSLNSLWPIRTSVKNGNVFIHMLAFQGFGTPSQTCIFTYDQVTKNLNGNILYRTGGGSANGLSFQPLSSSDFLISQSFSGGSAAYVSKISGGSVVYDRIIGGNISSVIGMDVSGSSLYLTGSASITGNTNALLVTGNTNLPVENNGCSVNDINSLNLQSSALPASTGTVVAIPNSASIVDLSLSFQNTNYSRTILCEAPLPVLLTDFSGKFDPSKKSSILNWTTSSEINSSYFEVERSIDQGRFFSKIGQVAAAGNSTTQRSYSFTDPNPPSGTVLYRLRQVDLDNSAQYSKIVSVQVPKPGKNMSFDVFPNPASNELNIRPVASALTADMSLTVCDINGKILFRKEIGNIQSGQTIKQDVSKLATGTYLLKISSNGAAEEVYKFVKL